MNEWNIFVILLNTANIIFLAAFMAKKIVWLRLLTITGNILVVPYYLYFIEPPLWNTVVWLCIYTAINLVMLFIIYLESRPISLSDLEQKIYDMTFKSLEPRVFKKLFDHGSLEELQPEVNFVTRDTELDSLMYVVEGEAEVVLKHGEHLIIPTGGFIGEQSYITGEKTSADVKTGKEAAKIIRWNSEALRKHLAGKEILKDNLDLIFTADLIHKLRDMEEDIDQIRHSQDLKIS
ncbi:cyclic nucleotide-binding protein [Marine Group I thaumarchaeote]|nr:cyclic nucleotide-binding protein [Marine Group I thaumarchaeote]